MAKKLLLLLFSIWTVEGSIFMPRSQRISMSICSVVSFGTFNALGFLDMHQRIFQASKLLQESANFIITKLPDYAKAATLWSWIFNLNCFSNGKRTSDIVMSSQVKCGSLCKSCPSSCSEDENATASRSQRGQVNTAGVHAGPWDTADQHSIISYSSIMNSAWIWFEDIWRTIEKVYYECLYFSWPAP